tara:strand:+ start:1427 stop:1801 length:375 start_codon:yes stop_codon:yes gene_type:complete
MSKPEWGKKIICPECETKFYDLNRKYPLPCPNCGHSIEQEIIPIASSAAKKVYEDDLETTVDDNLIGSDASESMLEDDTDEDIAMDDDEDTISLDDADVDVNDIDPELDGLDISSEEESSLDEK